MSYESNIAQTAHFFAGEDKILSYEVFASDGTTMENVSAFKMAWTLRKSIVGQDPHRAQGAAVITKSTEGSGPGITITGVHNATRATNSQRVIVTILDTDTEALAGGRYVCSLKRIDAGLEAVLSHGVVEVLVAAVR